MIFAREKERHYVIFVVSGSSDVISIGKVYGFIESESGATHIVNIEITSNTEPIIKSDEVPSSSVWHRAHVYEKKYINVARPAKEQYKTARQPVELFLGLHIGDLYELVRYVKK